MCLHIFSQKVGVTATLPNEVPCYLPYDYSGPHEWTYSSSSLWHNRMAVSTDHPNLNNLKRHQTVGFLLTSDGQLHVYHDGRHTKKLATNLPVNHHLWGAVDVFANCTKIKSELLSGELDGFCMHLYFIVCTQYKHKYSGVSLYITHLVRISGYSEQAKPFCTERP